MLKTLLIRNGRVIDPSQNMEHDCDVFLSEGRVAAVGAAAPPSAEQVLDAHGLLVVPGLIDMHVHLRTPGMERAETIETGTRAAAAGGFTALACMPNTAPPLDSDTLVRGVLHEAQQSGCCRVYPMGAITKGRQGRELAEIGRMQRSGAVAFSDDGDGIQDAGVCLKAMQYVAMHDALFVQHCEDISLAGGGCMHAGPTCTRLGLPGIPGLAEEVMVERDIRLAEAAGVRYHMCHVSTAGAVDLIRKARARGLHVSTEICPHHLLLTDEACSGYDTNFKMNPPLRSAADVAACVEGVRDGTIECLVTDHAPHPPDAKELPFEQAPFGIIGLESALALFIKALIDPGVLTWPQLIAAMSTRPAELLRVPGGTLKIGSPADVTLIDPSLEWTLDSNAGQSRSRNTPFHGWKVRGRAVATIVGGRVAYPFVSTQCATK